MELPELAIRFTKRASDYCVRTANHEERLTEAQAAEIIRRCKMHPKLAKTIESLLHHVVGKNGLIYMLSQMFYQEKNKLWKIRDDNEF